MKRRPVSAFVLILLASLGCSNNHNSKMPASARLPEIKIGSPAPDFTLRDMIEKNTTLSEYKGKVVLLTFWNMKCRDCTESMPSLEAINQRFKKEGLDVLAVNADNLEYVKPEKIIGFIKSKDYTFNVLFDETFSTSETYKIVAIPMTFLIDKTGTVTYTKFGKEDWTSRDNIERIQNLIR